MEIPKTIEEASSRLEGIDSLLTAKGWERAAIIYAFTRDGEPGERVDLTRTNSGTSLVPREFAALKLAGLRSENTVRAYRKAWQTAIESGEAVHVEPGDQVALPTSVFPPTALGKNDEPRDRDAEALERVKADPERARAFVVELVEDPVVIDDPTTRSAVSRSVDEATQRQHVERVQRGDRIKDRDPVSRRMDQGEALTDLTGALVKFARDVEAVMPRLGDLPDAQRFWLDNAFSLAEAALAQVRRYKETGQTDIDVELAALLKEAE